MKGASSHPQSEPQGEPGSVSGTQPLYRFTRQPVKYHRHINSATRSPNPFHTKRQPEAPDSQSHPESVDSSRSSSPEPRAQSLSQDSDLHGEDSCRPQQSSAASESNVRMSPQEIAQFMLRLDSTYISASRQESTQAGQHDDLNVNHSNNRPSQGRGQTPCQSSQTLPHEHKLTSPAQKILSGLKLRRSQSGKDDQLFV